MLGYLSEAGLQHLYVVCTRTYWHGIALGCFSLASRQCSEHEQDNQSLQHGSAVRI